MKYLGSNLIAAGCLCLGAGSVVAHPGHSGEARSGVVLGYELDQDHITADGKLHAVAGEDVALRSRLEFSQDPLGESARFDGEGLDGEGAFVLLSDSVRSLGVDLPTEQMTISSWVRIDKTTRWGGVVSAVSDNGEREKGWVLGYNNESFGFALSTEGADDGDGKLTYFQGKTKIQPRRWYFLTATYDGQTAKLYVNGQLDAQTTAQSGDILYDMSTPVALGAYIDSNEKHPMTGRLRNAYVLDHAVSAQQVRREFERFASLAELRPEAERAFEWVVEPFLCYATQDAVSLVCEIPVEGEVTVRYRPAKGEVKSITSPKRAGIHTVRIEGLEAGQPYYYEVIAQDANGERIKTETLSFQTAVERGKAITFVMIGDTQANPQVVKKVSDIAFAHRPNFVCIAGDLVTTGTNKSHWTHHFFPNMQPLLSRVPLFPVLGNHEQNARHYYEYMDLPDPEYYYSYSYGDADFFVLDSEKPMGPGSEQYVWLERQLAESPARWKFVIHHRPAYSSEENDHGDSWTGPTVLGDTDVRKAVPLYEKYGVDIVFNGHLHLYERTFPIRQGEAVEKNGVIYMTIGGGGGGLEDFAPFNPWFGNKKVSTHHLCFVAIVGGHLQMQSIDEEGRLFDMINIRKD